MSGLTTHVLDVGRGRPAAGVTVRLERRDDDGAWRALAERRTDDDGRVRDFGVALEPGVHRLTFGVGPYYRAQGESNFHPEVPIVFEVNDAAEHHHVPLLLNRFGYSTYRGS